MTKSGYGIVICGGGYRYFPSSWITIRQLRVLGCTLPIELWVTPEEYHSGLEALVRSYNVRTRIARTEEISHNTVPEGMRWQWALKPLSLLETAFQHVLFLDADNLPVRNPTYLFDLQDYRQTGALFWPDIPRPSNCRKIWEHLDLAYRDEPEFESGQMVVDTLAHREPLDLTMAMNRDAEIYYQMVWGDKDTFRFAWHKCNRAFRMTPHPVQMLSLPGDSEPSPAAMCQHDFAGERVFQHRNRAKWDLVGDNPRIPGFLFENECRTYLAELRDHWNGEAESAQAERLEIVGQLEERHPEYSTIVHDVTSGVWLVDNRRPRVKEPGGKVERWSRRRVSKPWELLEPQSEQPTASLSSRTGTSSSDRSTSSGRGGKVGFAAWEAAERASGERASPRYWEISFNTDYSVGSLACTEHYWWMLDNHGGEWTLLLQNPEGVSARLTLTARGWEGAWTQAPLGRLSLYRLGTVYPEANVLSIDNSRTATTKRRRGMRDSKASSLRIANCAYGIGDALTGLYAATGLTRLGVPVTYHTRFPQWMLRAHHYGLVLTADAPPNGTPDMDTDYSEQLRYGKSKADWYMMRTVCDLPSRYSHLLLDYKNLNDKGEQPALQPMRPEFIDRSTDGNTCGLSKYVILAPCVASQSREWPEVHWRRLANLLVEHGYEVVAIGREADLGYFERTFNKSNAYWAVNQSPEWITSAMLECSAVIGLDSGMIHVAGLLGVSAICIHAHLPQSFLFQYAPSVTSIVPRVSCACCRWRYDRGFNDGCAVACSALASVSAEGVLEKFFRLGARESLERENNE